jgi:hypothetical protein
MTQQTASFPPASARFTPLSTVHQERAPATTYQSFVGLWDFTKDRGALGLLPGTSDVSGVLWAHVDSFNGSAASCDTRSVCDGPLVTNINNHYTATTVTEANGVIARFVPSPIPVVWHVGGWVDGYDGDPGPGDPAELPWTAVLQNTGTGTAGVLSQFAGEIHDQSSLYGASALALLGSVTAGTADIVVGDDVATGITRPSAQPMAALVVANGSAAQVVGALQIHAGKVAGIEAAAGTALPHQDLLSYDAYDARLFGIGVAGDTATLTPIDVPSALIGVAQPLPVSITGSVPTHPVAMAWNGISRSLYVVDQPGASPFTVTRLLQISPGGVAVELWRTHPSCTAPSARLSVSAAGEVVLGLGDVPIPGSSEVVVLDPDGRALLSTDIVGRLAAPTFAIPRGIDLALHSPLPGQSSLLTRVVPRRDLAAGICGALWLQAQVDASDGSSALGSCRWEDGGDDEDD